MGGIPYENSGCHDFLYLLIEVENIFVYRKDLRILYTRKFSYFKLVCCRGNADETKVDGTTKLCLEAIQSGTTGIRAESL